MVVLIAALCCGQIFLATWQNNSRLHKFAGNLFDYPLPPRTEEIDRSAKVGVFGNGHHCDFVARISLVTELSREEINAYYKDVTFPAVSGQPTEEKPWKGLIRVRVQFEDKESIDERLQFTISIADIGYPSNGDIRCH
jgi:hypothetical protein